MSSAATRHPTRPRHLGCVVVTVLVLLAVTVVFALSSRYRQLHRPSGSDATGLPVPARCELDPAILARTHTQNFERYSDASGEHLPEGGDIAVGCVWGQIRGRDGINPRHLEFYVSRFDIPRRATAARSEYDLQRQMPYAMGRRKDTPVPGLGDEAYFAVTTDKVDQSVMRLAVVQGNLLVNVYIRGEDRHLFWTTQMSTDEAERLSISAAQVLLHRNW